MKNLFKFIEDRYPEYPTPFKAKLVYNSESMTEEDLNIKGDLDLESTKTTQLPNNLKVGGYLDLRRTPITQLPDNLQVGRNLFLFNTEITQLPNNLKVGGDLGLENTPITEKYSKEQILQIIEDKGGFVKGEIFI